MITEVDPNELILIIAEQTIKIHRFENQVISLMEENSKLKLEVEKLESVESDDPS